MDAAELRAMQAPIKERYKSDPSAAVITLKAKVGKIYGLQTAGVELSSEAFPTPYMLQTKDDDHQDTKKLDHHLGYFAVHDGFHAAFQRIYNGGEAHYCHRLTKTPM